MMTEKYLVLGAWGKINAYIHCAAERTITGATKLEICLFMLSAKAQKSQEKPIARFSPRDNALTFYWKSCARKHLRAPLWCSTWYSHLGKGTLLFTLAKVRCQTDCTVTHDAFQESGCEGLGDSTTTVNQVQYSNVDSWQLLLIELTSHLHCCPSDRLAMGTTPRDTAQYRGTWSPTTPQHYVYWRSTCHFILKVNDCSKGKIKIHFLKKAGFVMTKRFSIH